MSTEIIEAIIMPVLVKKDDGSRFIIKGFGFDIKERAMEQETAEENAGLLCALVPTVEFKGEFLTVPVKEDGERLDLPPNVQYHWNVLNCDVAFLSGPMYDNAPEEAKRPQVDEDGNCLCPECVEKRRQRAH